MKNVITMIEKRADEDFVREFNTKKVAEAESTIKGIVEREFDIFGRTVRFPASFKPVRYG